MTEENEEVDGEDEVDGEEDEEEASVDGEDGESDEVEGDDDEEEDIGGDEEILACQTCGKESPAWGIVKGTFCLEVCVIASNGEHVRCRTCVPLKEVKKRVCEALKRQGATPIEVIGWSGPMAGHIAAKAAIKNVLRKKRALEEGATVGQAPLDISEQDSKLIRDILDGAVGVIAAVYPPVGKPMQELHKAYGGQWEAAIGIKQVATKAKEGDLQAQKDYKALLAADSSYKKLKELATKEVKEGNGKGKEERKVFDGKASAVAPSWYDSGLTL